MFEVIFSVLLLFLAFIGLIEIFHLVSLTLFKTKSNTDSLTVIPMHGHNEEAEYVLRNTISNVSWVKGSGTKRIICLDVGMDEETRQICDILSNEYDYVDVCTIEEFEDYILKISS